MAKLITLNDLANDRNINLKSGDMYDVSGKPAYSLSGEKIGTVKDALAEPDSGRLRYLVLDAGGWFSSKDVLVPVGLARIEDDAVYFDTLEKEQVNNLENVREDVTAYDYEAQVKDERVLRGDDVVVEEPVTAAGTYNYRDDDVNDTLFKTPDRLRLLEERLVVDKERYVAGSVEIGKHVENRQERADVNLTHEEAVIERRPVSDPRPVEGNVQLGADNQTIRVDLEAERANVRKEAMVTEEIDVKERTVSETQTFTENVGREVLDVNETGDVKVDGSGAVKKNDKR